MKDVGCNVGLCLYLYLLISKCSCAYVVLSFYTLCVWQSGELVSEPVKCPIPKKWVRLGLGLG